jgi:plasmid stabilization system protein ParE
MKSVEFLPGARRDFDESFDWYRERSDGAAARFSDSVDEALIRIATDPEQCAAIDSRHRECLLARFPFRIVYRIELEQVVVVAIAHASRRPGYWKRRAS